MRGKKNHIMVHGSFVVFVSLNSVMWNLCNNTALLDLCFFYSITYVVDSHPLVHSVSGYYIICGLHFSFLQPTFFRTECSVSVLSSRMWYFLEIEHICACTMLTKVFFVVVFEKYSTFCTLHSNIRVSSGKLNLQCLLFWHSLFRWIKFYEFLWNLIF